VCKPGLKDIPTRYLTCDRSIGVGAHSLRCSSCVLRIPFLACDPPPRSLLSTSPISASSRSNSRSSSSLFLSLSLDPLSPPPPVFYYAAKLALIGSTSIAVMRKVVGASSHGRQLRPRRTLCRSFLLLRRSNKFSDRSPIPSTTDNFIEAELSQSANAQKISKTIAMIPQIAFTHLRSSFDARPCGGLTKRTRGSPTSVRSSLFANDLSSSRYRPSRRAEPLFF